MVVVLLLGFIFFARNAHLQLATDDVGWLQGQAPTVFDQYRLLPRLFFMGLYTLAGANPVAALSMIYTFHLVNTILVFDLYRKILPSSAGALAAAFVFTANPITLSTLTWISCFSYVLGTTLALLALEFILGSLDASHPWPWMIAALGSYAAGIFSSHEVLFLPAVFPILGWLKNSRKSNIDYANRRAVIWTTSLVGLCLGALVNFTFYSFDRYGVETTRLFSLGFLSAFVSSALSFGFSLWLAYPLSFIIPATPFLQLAFSEPVRWAITLILVCGSLLFFTNNQAWRTRLALAGVFIVLVTPYIIRFYLMPAGVNYDISYVLSGRVFYLSFVSLAWFWGFTAGEVASALHARFGRPEVRWILPALAGTGYLYALLALYRPQDFMGLAVMKGSLTNPPPSWNPYLSVQPLWLASLLLAAAAAGARWLAGYYRYSVKG